MTLTSLSLILSFSSPSGIVLQRIEEYSLSINELKEESAKLKKDAEAFNLEVGSFDSLDEVAADVAATKAQWDRYADFLKERNEMADKDWLSARDQVWKIEDFLTKWTKATEGKVSSTLLPPLFSSLSPLPSKSTSRPFFPSLFDRVLMTPL